MINFEQERGSAESLDNQGSSKIDYLDPNFNPVVVFIGSEKETKTDPFPPITRFIGGAREVLEGGES